MPTIDRDDLPQNGSMTLAEERRRFAAQMAFNALTLEVQAGRRNAVPLADVARQAQVLEEYLRGGTAPAESRLTVADGAR